jgi:conjugal transfer/entry exclusion protein
MIQSDLGTLQNLGAAPGTDSSSAVAAGNKALSNAAGAISWANQQGNAINNQAQQLATTATNYANSHCG